MLCEDLGDRMGVDGEGRGGTGRDGEGRGGRLEREGIYVYL